jgi:hypothetical protein
MEIRSLDAILFMVQPFLEKLSLAGDNKVNLTSFLLLLDQLEYSKTYQILSIRT